MTDHTVPLFRPRPMALFYHGSIAGSNPIRLTPDRSPQAAQNIGLSDRTPCPEALCLLYPVRLRESAGDAADVVRIRCEVHIHLHAGARPTCKRPSLRGMDAIIPPADRIPSRALAQAAPKQSPYIEGFPYLDHTISAGHRQGHTFVSKLT